MANDNNTRPGSPDPVMLQYLRDAGLSSQVEQIERQYGINFGAIEAALDNFITKDPVCLAMKDDIRRLAVVDDPVLIQGETGTGKEIVAKALGQNRKAGRFVAINVAAIPKELVESTLFGVVKGSYTGATLDKNGLIQHAGEGTLFLDEIGDLSLDLQAKFLRVLQDLRVRRVGDLDETEVKCRFVTASHMDIAQLVKDGRFRIDLFARLSTFIIKIPPLRDRLCDIPPIMAKLEPLFPVVKVNWAAVDLSLNVRSLIQYARRYKVLGQLPTNTK